MSDTGFERIINLPINLMELVIDNIKDSYMIHINTSKDMITLYKNTFIKSIMVIDINNNGMKLTIKMKDSRNLNHWNREAKRSFRYFNSLKKLCVNKVINDSVEYKEGDIPNELNELIGNRKDKIDILKSVINKSFIRNEECDEEYEYISKERLIPKIW